MFIVGPGLPLARKAPGEESMIYCLASVRAMRLYELARAYCDVYGCIACYAGQFSRARDQPVAAEDTRSRRRQNNSERADS